MATQIVPTDVSRTVPIYESYTLHGAIFAWMTVILQSTYEEVFTVSEREIALDFKEKLCFLAWITTQCSRLL